MERVGRIELPRAGRKHASLPLTYTRVGYYYIRMILRILFGQLFQMLKNWKTYLKLFRSNPPY